MEKNFLVKQARLDGTEELEKRENPAKIKKSAGQLPARINPERINQATKKKMREARTLYGSIFAAADDSSDNTPKCTKEVLPATLDLHWVLGTCLCIWFLWIYAPVILAAKDYIPSLLYIHLFGVYSIYMACVHNTLLTPSTFGGAARPFHIAIGRLGFILGIVGFVSGFILTWLSDETYDI